MSSKYLGNIDCGSYTYIYIYVHIERQRGLVNNSRLTCSWLVGQQFFDQTRKTTVELWLRDIGPRARNHQDADVGTSF